MWKRSFIKKGYAVGAVDGKIDQQTAIAISQFQMEAGSPATGQLTPQQAFMLMGQQAPAQAPAMAVQRQQPAAYATAGMLHFGQLLSGP